MVTYAFKDPWWFLVLLPIPLLIWWRDRRALPVILIPFAAAWHRRTARPFSRWPTILAIMGIVLFAAALARPMRLKFQQDVSAQGYDVILAIDLSTSMLAEDYETGGERINRLQAIKPILQAFMDQRPKDRIGIVLFSGRVLTLSALTSDHAWLARQIERLRIGLIEDGTAIGDGLGVSLTRLQQASREKEGKRSGAFVVLLSDGANNRGLLTPEASAVIARGRGIPVYTIGAGRDGVVPFPILDEQGNNIGYRQVLSELDETSLREIAETTGGQFFRADSTDTVKAAFAAIDRAQKVSFRGRSHQVATDLFPWLVAAAASLLVLAAVLQPNHQEASA